MGYGFEVNISINEQGGRPHFTYDPSALNVCGGDSVSWISEDGPFAVQFRESSPGSHMTLESVDSHGQWVAGPMPIRADARGRFHYGVAVCLQGRRVADDLRGRVMIDGGCPEIIVD